VVEDVERQFACGLVAAGLVGVVRLKVAIEDVLIRCLLVVGGLQKNELRRTYVVPVACWGHGRAEFDGQGPPAWAGALIGVHLVALGVVVPRAREVAALDVRGSAEGEGGSGSGGRHGDNDI